MAGFRLPSLLRRRWLWALAGLLLAMPALLLAVFYWWLLPNLPQYKDEVASLLSMATGYTITLDGIEGEWGGARPRLSLEGVRVSEGGRPILYFSKLEGRFGWRSLIALEPRFHELDIEAPAVTVRRSLDGALHIGGLRVDPNSPQTGFSDWLLKQYSVHMQGVTMAWIDDRQGGQPLVLRDVSFRMQNLFRRHAFQLGLTPPAYMARPLSLDGVLYGRSVSLREEWRGKIALEVPALELSAWSPWLPEDYRQLQGHGSIAVTLELDQGRLSASGGKLNLAGLRLAIPQLAAPLALDRLVGELGWRREHAGTPDQTQLVYARRLIFRQAGGSTVAPFDFSYSWGNTEQKLSAARLPVAEVAALAGRLPLQETWKAQLAALDPHGRLDSLELSWRGRLPAPEKVSVNANFTDLGWAAVEKIPRAARLSGMVSGNEEKGVYVLSGRQAGVDLPAVFAEPALRFDTLNIRGGWKRLGRQRYTLDIADAAFSNADLSVTLNGNYQLAGKGRGVADLSGRIERADGTAVARYLPRVAGEATHDWLKAAILQGEVREGSFRLQGDLAKFPFRTQADGSFRVAGKIGKGQLRYAADYPQIDDIDGDLLFEGVRMEISSQRARIYGTTLNKVKAVIADLSNHDHLLEISGEARGPAEDFVRFANASPVGGRLEGLTSEMAASGDMRLQLNLKIPLRYSSLTTLAGRLFIDNDNLSPAPDLPRLERVSGVLDFTGQSVSAPKISARLLGGPAQISAVTEADEVRVRGQGTFLASALDAWLGKELAARLSGKSNWKGELSLGRGKQARMRFESNLAGLGSSLPAPLGKPAGKPAAFVFEQSGLGDGSRRSAIQYGSAASAVWLSRPGAAGLEPERGEINFGGQAQMPEGPGLRLAGKVNDLDLGGWLDLLPAGQGGGAAGLSAIDLSLNSLELLGRKFNDIRVQGGLKGNLLRATVNGREMAGSFVFRRAAEGSVARVSAQFRQFTLPEPLPNAPPAKAIRLPTAGFPTFDLQVDDLKLGSRPMGRLEVIAHGLSDGLAIEQLDLTHPDSVIRMNGTWKNTGVGETRVKLNADIKDAGLMLGRFGFPGTVRKGVVNVEGELHWPRSPADFKFATLDGTLKFTAKKGQFLKLEPGAGKLLGVASLQSLPRRMTLDFSDVFSKGFAFDEISSTMQLADGAVYSNDFVMKGPAATVTMSGVAKLQDESVQLRVKVVPKLSEGVAVAGALLGGPVAGVGALVVQKVLKNPIEEAISYEYMVEGPWDKPTVTKLGKPKSAQEKETNP